MRIDSRPLNCRPTSPSMRAPLVIWPAVGWFCWTLLPDFATDRKATNGYWPLGYCIDLAIGSAEWGEKQGPSLQTLGIAHRGDQHIDYARSARANGGRVAVTMTTAALRARIFAASIVRPIVRSIVLTV